MSEKKPLIVWSKGRVDVPGTNCMFGPGDNEVDDPDIMRLMLRFPMPLKFSTQDMVDFGYLTAKEVVAAGYAAIDRETDKIPEVPMTADFKPPEGRPDLPSMGMVEIKKWAQEHDVVLMLEGEVPWDKQECVEACEKKADELGLPKGTKNLMKEPPTVEELEAILNEEDPGTVEILPNGEVTVKEPEPKPKKPAKKKAKGK